MLKWSVYFQNPEFLELSRKFLIEEDIKELVVKHCGISKGDKVLDVGCGTGYFARLIKGHSEETEVTGVDAEEAFIEYARSKAAEEQLEVEFSVGDALCLPFEDESFDAVTSHTFLTSISDPEAAMKEMIRVCRRGGSVSSVTAMDFDNVTSSMGYYSNSQIWAKPYEILKRKAACMYTAINPISEYRNDLPTTRIPHFFQAMGLGSVSIFPIGKAFSLSNAAISRDDKLQYLDLLERSEKEKIGKYLEMEEADKYLTKDEAALYLSLLHYKCEYYRKHPEENSIWEWSGGANLLVSGVK